MGTQLWFNLTPSDGKYRKDSFCNGPSNEAARQALSRSKSWSSGALIMVGPKGCGKSHLAELWRREHDGKSVSVSAIPARITGAAVIDITDEPIDEEGLFHLLNRAVSGMAQVLLVARCGPSAWHVQLGDLLSRLRAVELVRIDEPDDEVLMCILRKLSRDRSLLLNDKLLQYLVTRMERSSQSALQLIEALNARSLEGPRPINLALARQVLDEQQQHLNEFGS